VHIESNLPGGGSEATIFVSSYHSCATADPPHHRRTSVHTPHISRSTILLAAEAATASRACCQALPREDIARGPRRHPRRLRRAAASGWCGHASCLPCPQWARCRRRWRPLRCRFGQPLRAARDARRYTAPRAHARALRRRGGSKSPPPHCTRGRTAAHSTPSRAVHSRARCGAAQVPSRRSRATGARRSLRRGSTRRAGCACVRCPGGVPSCSSPIGATRACACCPSPLCRRCCSRPRRCVTTSQRCSTWR
jgi:hypothetical protein